MQPTFFQFRPKSGQKDCPLSGHPRPRRVRPAGVLTTLLGALLLVLPSSAFTGAESGGQTKAEAEEGLSSAILSPALAPAPPASLAQVKEGEMKMTDEFAQKEEETARQEIIRSKLAALRYNTTYGFEAREDPRGLAKQYGPLLKKVSFYDTLVHSSSPYQRVILALDEKGEAFALPGEIGRVLSDEFWGDLTKSKVGELARLYVALSAFPPHSFRMVESPVRVPYEKKRGISPAQFSKAIHPLRVKKTAGGFTAEFVVWSNVGGYLESWRLSLERREVSKKSKTLGQGIGDFEVEQ